MSARVGLNVESDTKQMPDTARSGTTDYMDTGQSESVKVAVRVRPFDQREKDASMVSVIEMNTKSKVVTIINNNPKKMHASKLRKAFQFDNVFWSLDSTDESGGKSASQVDVYEAIGRPLVQHAFNGFNSCLFAYGQTGSGKTYTMMGGDPNAVGGADAGVTPRLCLELFQERARLEAGGHSKWTVDVGYIEVYNERVWDLLARRKRASRDEAHLEVREHPTKGVFVEGQELCEVSSLEDVVGLIETGNRVRHTAATKMNDRSSRSHAIFMLMLREERTVRTATGDTITTAGKSSRMNLVDLAGSERVAQSEVVGQQFDEARHINLSLTTLGRVIDMLADMAKRRDSQWSMPPYRESKLTYILKDSLGGNSKTFMVATVSPSAMNYEETLSTLRYASRARDIVNVTRVNEDPRARRIRELEEQMDLMRREIKGTDPAYVAGLEEKLVLLEAEVQKRAADLQALEKEREKNEIREKMLHATAAEREELLNRARDLEQQVGESRRQAEHYEQANQMLKKEHAERERELLERMRLHEAEMERACRQKEAEVLSGQEQLRRTMDDLERERRDREDALRALGEQQEQLSAALRDSRQSKEQRAELERQNTELAGRMQQLEAEHETQRRVLHELERVRVDHALLETAMELLRIQLQEMERRHGDTVYHLLSTADARSAWDDRRWELLCVEQESQLSANAEWYANLHATLKRQQEEELTALQLRLDSSALAGHELRTTLAAVTEERDELQRRLAETRERLVEMDFLFVEMKEECFCLKKRFG